MNCHEPRRELYIVLFLLVQELGDSGIAMAQGVHRGQRQEANKTFINHDKTRLVFAKDRNGLGFRV